MSDFSGGGAVVTNRHIYVRWNTFTAPPEGRRVSLCNRSVKGELMGVPGVSRQQRMVNGKPGWCPVCIKELLTKNVYTDAIPDPDVLALYNKVYTEALEFVKEWAERNQ